MGAKVVATFDTVQLHGWSGWIEPIQDIVDAENRVGQEGSVIQITGRKSNMTQVMATRVYADAVTARADALTLADYQGTTVKIVDPWGRTLPRVRVHEIKAKPIVCFGTGPGTSGAAARIEITMTLEALP
jgi:hypothetical protein